MKTSFQAIKTFFAFSSFCLVIGFSLMSFQLVSDSPLEPLEESTCPTASFTIQNNGCTGPCGVTFTNQSIDAASYHWDFGDGNVSCSSNPTHTYQEAGTYTVRLRAIGIGCSHEFIGTVDIIGV